MQRRVARRVKLLRSAGVSRVRAGPLLRLARRSHQRLRAEGQLPDQHRRPAVRRQAVAGISVAADEVPGAHPESVPGDAARRRSRSALNTAEPAAAEVRGPHTAAGRAYVGPGMLRCC